MGLHMMQNQVASLGGRRDLEDGTFCRRGSLGEALVGPAMKHEGTEAT